MYHDVEQLALQVMVLKESKTHASLAFTKHKATCSLLPPSTLPISHCHASPHTTTPRSKRASSHAAQKSKTWQGSQSHLYGRHPSAIVKAHCSNSWVHLEKPGHVEEEPSTTSSLEKASLPFPGQENQLHTNSWLEDEPGKVTARELHPPVPQPDHLRPRPAVGSPLAARALGVLCPGAIPSEPWHKAALLHLTLSFHWNTGRHSCAISTERKNDKASETAQQASDTELCAGLGLIYGAAVQELHKEEV